MPGSAPLQEIPRPATWRPGAPAPWAVLAASERSAITVDRVLDALAGRGQAGRPPRGLGIEDLLYPLDRMVAETAPPRPDAGVLAALFEEHGEAHLVLTRRSSRMRTHTNDVSFPGGRLDEGEDPAAAALREAHEEIGLDAAAVTMAGWLHPVVVPRSNSLVVPAVATLPGRPQLVPNPSEVDRVFDVALAELATPEIFHEEYWTVPERAPFAVWFFEVEGEIVWGATARMIHELLTIVLVGRGES